VARATVRQLHGGRGETVAARYLEGLGWRVVARQVRVGRDEVDILALDPGPPANLVAVEVRSRSSSRFGPPEASVGRAKLLHCYRAMGAVRRSGRLADGTRLPPLPWRVDLVAVDLDEPLGAFYGEPDAGGPRIRHLRAVLPP
jgi:Holliday junction resolvase-like predicted endonuclease